MRLCSAAWGRDICPVLTAKHPRCESSDVAGISFYRSLVTVFNVAAEPPLDFQRAVISMDKASIRPEIDLTAIPAPRRVAPFGKAVEADVLVDDEVVGSGRFIMLHDPAGADAWNGVFRVVTYATASMDPALADDECLASVGWSWLTESLDAHSVAHGALGGTVTRVYNDSFGDLAEHPRGVEVQMRASWTPAGVDLGANLVAWLDTLCVLSGLPPLPPGVTALPRRAH